MRYPKERKNETHAHIVQAASVQLRKFGVNGVSIVDLMRNAGLTHGGFYTHFESRSALVRESFSFTIDQTICHWRELIADRESDGLTVITDAYLSRNHRDNPETGCALPAFGPAMGRADRETRSTFSEKLQEMIQLIADQPSHTPDAERRQQAIAAIATMVGAIILARGAGDDPLSDEILVAGRHVVLGRDTWKQ